MNDFINVYGGGTGTYLIPICVGIYCFLGNGSFVAFVVFVACLINIGNINIVNNVGAAATSSNNNSQAITTRFIKCLLAFVVIVIFIVSNVPIIYLYVHIHISHKNA